MEEHKRFQPYEIAKHFTKPVTWQTGGSYQGTKWKKGREAKLLFPPQIKMANSKGRNRAEWKDRKDLWRATDSRGHTWGHNILHDGTLWMWEVKRIAGTWKYKTLLREAGGATKLHNSQNSLSKCHLIPNASEILFLHHPLSSSTVRRENSGKLIVSSF